MVVEQKLGKPTLEAVVITLTPEEAAMLCHLAQGCVDVDGSCSRRVALLDILRDIGQNVLRYVEDKQW